MWGKKSVKMCDSFMWNLNKHYVLMLPIYREFTFSQLFVYKNIFFKNYGIPK